MGGREAAGGDDAPAFTILDAAVYGGKFNAALNEIFSRASIGATAAKVAALEKTMGRFALPYFVRHLLDAWPPAPEFAAAGGFDQYEKHFLTIPEDIRKRVSDVLRANFQLPNPLPIYSQVVSNVDPHHDLRITLSTVDDVLYIGIIFLCPPPRSALRSVS